MGSNKTTVISENVLAEGEKDKAIQSSQIGITRQQLNLPLSQPISNHSQDKEVLQPQGQVAEDLNNTSKNEPHLRCSVRPRKPEGAYKLMHEGKSVVLADEDMAEVESHVDFAFAAPMGSAMLTLDEVLQGLNAKQWQVALDYELS